MPLEAQRYEGAQCDAICCCDSLGEPVGLSAVW